MNENEKKALTIAAMVAGYIAWFMGKAMTSGALSGLASARTTLVRLLSKTQSLVPATGLFL